MLHLLLGTDWTANRDEVMKRIAADVAGRRGNRILMVPELISHETERRLCAAAGDTASRYAEVLSFTRLARRVADSMGSAAEECLDNGGRVVAMAAAAKNLSSRLKAYAAVETKPEFLTGLIDAVDEFKRCCISSADLSRAAGETEGSLAQKLEELSLLMESYDALCSRGKRDPRDQMTWLLEQMEQGDFAREHVFYIDGFPDFTRQHLAILEHLIQASPDVTVSLNCDREDSRLLAFEKAGDTASQLLRCARRAGVEVKIETVPGKRLPLSPLREGLFQGVISRGAASGCLDVFRAESPYLECMGAAERIRGLLAAGCRCRDITVVCTDMTVYQPLVNLVFHRLHIPVYQSGTEDILQKSVIATVLMALDAALSGFDQKSVLRYLRSALSPVDPDTCDRIENYAIIWGIRGQKWTQSWENHPDGLSGVWTEEDQHRLEELNTARELAIAPLTRLWQGFRDASDLRGQILALYGFLEDISLEMRLSRMAQELDAAGDNRAAQILNQLWEILLGALEQMYDMLGDTHWEGEQFIRLFRLLLSQYDVGTIPPVLDAVQVGPVSAMRCHQEKHLIVLGAEEGKLPGYSGSAGVLTDQERVTLRELGVPLTGGAMEGVQAEFAEIYGCFCGAMASVSVFCSGRGTAGEKHIGFCPGGWTGSGGVPRPVGRRGRCRTFECPGYISGNLPPAGLPLRKGGAGNHWQTLRLDAESFRLPDRPAGGMPPVLFPQVRPSGAGAEGSRHRPGGIRNLCPCGAGKFRPPHSGTGRIPQGFSGRNAGNCPRVQRGIRPGAFQPDRVGAGDVPVPTPYSGAGHGGSGAVAGAERGGVCPGGL